MTPFLLDDGKARLEVAAELDLDDAVHAGAVGRLAHTLGATFSLL